MDGCQCTSLIDHFKALPDPRQARGRRHCWWVILTIAAAARLAGQHSDQACAQWAKLHRRTLALYLPLFQDCTPSQSTFQRAFAKLDRARFEAAISRFIGDLNDFLSGLEPPAEGDLRGLAVDGKGVNGATRHGAKTHLLGLVDHRHAAVLAQTNVAEKTNEIPVAQQLLADWPLAGCVVTGDAMHCQRETASLVLAQQGDYLLQVKDNQETLCQEIALLFASPRSGPHPVEIRTTAQTGGGHGRVEARFLEASDALNDYLAETLGWPGVGQVVHRVCRRWVKGRATCASEEHHYWITSLRPEQASPAQLERLCRGHWTIENRVHWCRDVTFGEDRANQRCGAAPQARAALVNAVMALVRAQGVRLLTEAIRFYQARPIQALKVLGCRRL